MSKCPHCNKDTISIKSRLTIGPIFSKTCCECHNKWSVSYITVLWIMVPFLVSKYDIGVSNDITIPVAIVTMFVGLFYLTPIVKR